jgi:transcriptional regulator with XRE-family HTH domain
VENIKSLLGKRIRDLRKQRGLSQEGLGWKAELHFTYIGAVERGERNCSIITLKKIAKGLEIDIKDLFDTPFHKTDINKLKK